MTLLCIPIKTEEDKVKAFERADLIELQMDGHKILKNKADEVCFVDLDWKSSLEKQKKICALYPVAKLIISYHNFHCTPKNLPLLYKKIQRSGAHIYKIASMGRSSLDSMRMLEFLKEKENLIGICMGEKGQITRLLSPIFSSPIAYCSLSENCKTAPGQIPIDTLLNIYRFKQLNIKTGVYALIGDPVEQSIGHIFHNGEIQKDGDNALYVKIAVKKSELKLFLTFVQKLPFKGLSVTMPLKEKIVPLLHHLNPEVKRCTSCNTIIIHKGKLIGSNTDGKAAVILLKKNMGSLKEKKIVIVGSGGSAKAIAHACLKEEANVQICVRNEKKIGHLKKNSNLSYHNLESIREGYDVMINATPSSMPISEKMVFQNKILMNLPITDGDFIKIGKEKGCRCISGLEFFIQQAVIQRQLWNK